MHMFLQQLPISHMVGYELTYSDMFTLNIHFLTNAKAILNIIWHFIFIATNYTPFDGLEKVDIIYFVDI